MHNSWEGRKMPLSDYVHSLCDEEKDHYYKKLHQIGFLHGDDDPYLLEEWKSEGHLGKWSSSMQSWPELEFGDIYVYLIDFPGYSPRTLKMYKSLDAYKYFVKGLVHELHIQHSENGHSVIRGSVHRSHDVADEPWKAWVGFKNEDAHIVATHCTCMTGLTLICSHVVAIMFQVEAARHSNLKEDASTSQQVSLLNEQMSRALLQEDASRGIMDINLIKREKLSPDVETERWNTSSSSHCEVDQPNVRSNELFQELSVAIVDVIKREKLCPLIETDICNNQDTLNTLSSSHCEVDQSNELFQVVASRAITDVIKREKPSTNAETETCKRQDKMLNTSSSSHCEVDQSNELFQDVTSRAIVDMIKREKLSPDVETETCNSNEDSLTSSNSHIEIDYLNDQSNELLQDVASRAIMDFMNREKLCPIVETERCDSPEDMLFMSSSGQYEIDQSNEEKFEGVDSTDMDVQTEELSRKAKSTKSVKNHPAVARNLKVKGLPSCHICNSTFTSKFLFESHMKRLHNGIGSLWKIQRRRPLTLTLTKERKSDPGTVWTGNLFKCEECDKSYLKKRSLLRHMQIHTGEQSFKCDECGKGFSERHRLHNHMQTHTKGKPFKCTECSRVYRNGNILYAHVQMHRRERPHKCNECGKNFKTATDINTHMKMHTGEKPLKCGKGFTYHSNLNAHIRIHKAEKPFTCNECGQVFNRIWNLQRHITKHTGERPFLCSLCGESFRNGFLLRNHMKIHLPSGKPMVCIECGKSFRYSSNLGIHMRCHTGERPFKCDECGKGFTQRAHLTTHTMKIHTCEKPCKVH